MKTQILDIHGKKSKEIELPKFFSQKVREDLIFKILETKKTKQPFSPSPIAGTASAAGKIVHARHVWRSGYGRGISRVPRKIMSESGSQFNWVGAEVPGMRGGRKAHPPKVVSMINTKKINKKEERIAFESALSATASAKEIMKKYSSLRNEKIEFPTLPLVVDSKITELKTKEFVSSLKNILGKLFDVSIPKKSIRHGKGKQRGRKYKQTAGVLIVVGKDEDTKTKIFDVKNVGNLSVLDLANGGPGRITIYTEKAIKDLEEKLK
jgi:ribosomal protein L4